ncbi:MAG TPA: thiamine-binding protein [Draconibacterium sp.]|nr:thiamine-binding protein [Draconibacterium sp.]
MSWETNKINVAIQVLPEGDGKVKYELVDKAIEAIQQSGFRYQVCPFETVVECGFNDLSGLLESIHSACNDAGTQRMITNLKVQVNFEHDVAIEDKMDKYT